MIYIKTIGSSVLSFLVCASVCQADGAGTNLVSSQRPAGTLGESLRREVHASLNRGLDWLAANQNADGSWSDSNFPALTALPVWTFAQSQHPGKDEILRKGVAFLLSCAQTNGGIYRNVPGRKGGGLGNYNTAIAITALHAVGDPALVPIIQRGRQFIAASQLLGDDAYSGGFGYDRETQRPYTDLLNTYYAAQAMRLTADVEDQRKPGEQRADINWKETAKFVERMQNKPESGEAEAGGFYYNPTDPKAGTTSNKTGVVVMRAYGSITYAGLLALVYADVTRDDPRVRSAFDWAVRHWSLDENPGMGTQGLYFFYDVLSRCLRTYGRQALTLPNGSQVNWKADLARKLVSLQKTEEKTGHGYWENSNGRYWEGNRVLVTSYSLLALEQL